jgi:hypothetical protein
VRVYILHYSLFTYGAMLSVDILRALDLIYNETSLGGPFSCCSLSPSKLSELSSSFKFDRSIIKTCAMSKSRRCSYISKGVQNLLETLIAKSRLSCVPEKTQRMFLHIGRAETSFENSLRASPIISPTLTAFLVLPSTTALVIQVSPQKNSWQSST